MLHTYEGYFENGQIFPFVVPAGIVGRRKVIITILNEPTAESTTPVNEHAGAWAEFLTGISEVKDEPVELERVNFQEVDI